TAPCSTRKATRASSVGEKPHSHEDSTKSRVEIRNSRTCPKRWVSQPVNGTVMALATANEVMTQVPWLALTPRSPEMLGMETLAMDVSSTFMNTAVDSAIDPTMRVAPVRGGCSAARAGRAGSRDALVVSAAGWALIGWLSSTMLRRAAPAPSRCREIAAQDLCDHRVGVGRAMVEYRRGQRLAGRLAGGVAVLADVDFHVHGQPDAQGVLGELLRIQGDAHRHALHDLDPVTGGVLRGQQGERAAGAGVQADHRAVVDDRAAVHVRG